jgi:hypothetical protein
MRDYLGRFKEIIKSLTLKKKIFFLGCASFLALIIIFSLMRGLFDAKLFDNTVGNNQVEKEGVLEGQGTRSVTRYKNQTYAYGLDFLDGWHMNNDDSESKMENFTTDSGITLQRGGQTFWSNYSDISKYTPENKPGDFKILSLTVYKDSSKSIDDFAKKTGASDFATEQDVQAKNISGKEYISTSFSGDETLITSIFQKGDSFYVFKPAFLKNDEAAADAMESIVRSFEIL